MEQIQDFTLKLAALDYATQGIAVLPLIPNTKKPLTERGYLDASTNTTVINQWWDKWPDANIGMVTGSINGVIVLDVDSKDGKDGRESLQELENRYGALPETRRHNTPSGGYHLLFSIGSVVVRGSAGKIGVGLDIRCDGGYIVAPPSVIDGNRYQVLNQDAEIAEAPEWLIALATEKKAEVVTGQVSKGERNSHIFKTAMDCKRQGLSYADAEKLVSEANNVCTPPLDEVEVSRTLNSAYRYEVNSIPPEILEMNKTHAAIKMGGNCYVLEEITCPVFDRPDFELLTTKGFKEYYCNQYVQVDGKKLPLGAAWFGHPARKSYEGLTFNPKYTPKGYYNMWQGFAVEPKEGDCSLFLKNVEENIANGDKAIYEYILGWMAQVVQHPDELIGVAIVMRGSMGVGKGVFANGFGSLFGRHYMLLNDSGQLTGKFNGFMKDKCLLFADEAFWAGDKSSEGKLKSMITEPTLNIEMKGKDLFQAKNNLHMIFATNNDWAAPAGPKERRFFIIDVGDKRQGDHKYFEAIQNELDNGGREALLHFLINYDISEMNLRKFPQTAALREAKQLSFTPVQKFWHHVLETGSLHHSIEGGWGEGSVQTEYLYQEYQKFVQNMGIKHKATDTELGMLLKNMLPKDEFKKERRTVQGYAGMRKVTERKNCYVFPSLAKCRDAFNKFVSTEMDWPAD